MAEGRGVRPVDREAAPERGAGPDGRVVSHLGNPDDLRGEHTIALFVKQLQFASRIRTESLPVLFLLLQIGDNLIRGWPACVHQEA